MTIAQVLRNAGMQQGMQEEKFIIAKSMLEEGLPERTVIKCTGLDPQEILQLKQHPKKG